MYLTFQEYQNMGGTLDSTSYTMYEFEARSEIDWYTFGRLKYDTSIPEEVKMCMFVIIAELQKMDSLSAVVTPESEENNTTNSAIASMSNDGVSLGYNQLSAGDGIANSKDKITQTIERYLQGVTNELGRKVLYRGLYPNE